MRSSGDGLALATWLTMDQTFCLAVSMTGPIEPEQSMQKTMSILGLSSAAAGAAAAGFGASAALAAIAKIADATNRVRTIKGMDTRVVMETSVWFPRWTPSWRKSFGNAPGKPGG